ncbi:MAG: RusA family crossover junction endodeoxyribonuclease, partial [Planctomycetes bacterium]|nr:RusA family crossover junction endodeoxyribonuclease [Planctomycetota bacterium]
MIELALPYPPSVNHYFSYYQGRPVLSKDARSYRHQVRRIAIASGIKPLMGPLAIRIDITPPDDRRRDCDNVQKAVLDALQHAGAFWDDSQVIWLLSIKHESQPSGTIRVQLSDAAAQTL